jgi:hypothetical protein
MFRNSLLLALILAMSISTFSFAQENGSESSAENPVDVATDPSLDSAEDGIAKDGDDTEKLRVSYLKAKNQFTFSAGVGINQYQWNFTGAFQVDFNANPVMGAGIKTTVDYGFEFGNLNINLFAVYKVWWFYMGPGISFKVLGMTLPPDSEYEFIYNYDSIISLALTLGFRFPIARIGPGHMTMDISVDWYQNDIPLSKPLPPFSGVAVQELVNGTAYAFKFEARIGYTF